MMPPIGSWLERAREGFGARRLILVAVSVAVVVIVTVLLPGSWELKVVLASLAVIAILTTWFRIRHALGARRAASGDLPVECAVNWCERPPEIRDDRFPAGGFGGHSGILRIESEALCWSGMTLPVGEIEAALVLTPRGFAQRSADRVVLRIRSARGVWDFFLAQPWILERQLPFPLLRRSAPMQLQPARVAVYVAVLLALLIFVLLVGPCGPWGTGGTGGIGEPGGVGGSGGSASLLGAQRYEGSSVEVSYPRDGWSLTRDEVGGENELDLDLRIDGPGGRWLELRAYGSEDTPEAAARAEVGEAVASGCVEGPWIPAYGSYRGAGAVLVCGRGEEMSRRRLFFGSPGSGRLVRVVESHPYSGETEGGGPATGDEGFSIIERSLRMIETTGD